jgi:NADPH:quinone reductase-like Zn-dependent oxidoreductase
MKFSMPGPSLVTAWEALFDRLGIDPGGAQTGRSLLIIGGAGGVGSTGIQLAKLAGLVVIATASRPATKTGSCSWAPITQWTIVSQFRSS